MSDIVERLKVAASHPYNQHGPRDFLLEASDEIVRLRVRITELEGQHKGLVLNNAILRERPDLPLNRIPAARAMTKLYEDNERLRAALRETLEVASRNEAGDYIGRARAALEEK